MAFYIDYPGYPLATGEPPVLPGERLIQSRAVAVDTARTLYQRFPALPKVIVCEYPSGKRVATIYGRRSNPTVQDRQ